MGLFAFGHRRLVRDLVKQGVEPLFAPFERIHGIARSEVARDPYALGFVNGTIVMLALAESKGKLAGEKLGMVILAVLRAVLGPAAEQATKLTLDLQENPEFLRGHERAGKLVQLAYGVETYLDDPEIEQARRDFAEFRNVLVGVDTGGDEDGAFQGYLLKRFFTDQVMKNLRNGDGNL